jgi:hypothetical protein
LVVNKENQPIGVTYPKRAKGLVKKGRARYAGEMKIVLDEDAAPARPPISFNKSEDKMDKLNLDSERIIDNDGNVLTFEPEALSEAKPLTLQDILKRIDAITSQSAYILQALENISAIDTNGSRDGSPGEKAKAIGEIVRRREDTNQRIITMLERMYEDLRAQADKVNYTGIPLSLLEMLPMFDPNIQRVIIERFTAI